MALNLIKPKWELYDITNNPEHNLYVNYIVEFCDITGIKVNYYIRKENIVTDRLYGESTTVDYYTALKTKMIYEVTEETTMTNTFGIASEDIIQYGFIPKYTFSRDVSAGYNPKPGDVVQTPWNNRNYEVVDVGEEAHVFQLGKYVYEFILKPYRYSEQSDAAKEILNIPDSTFTSPVTGYGDNEWIEGESDTIDNYSNVDTDVYGY